MAVRSQFTSILLMFLLLCSALLATTLQGVQGEVDVEGPSESECRPYIEKALKKLETGDAQSAEVQDDIAHIVTTDDSETQGDSLEITDAETSKSAEEGTQEDVEDVGQSIEDQDASAETGDTQEVSAEEKDVEDSDADDGATEEVADESAEKVQDEASAEKDTEETQSEEKQDDTAEEGSVEDTTAEPASKEEVDEGSVEQDGSVEEGTEQVQSAEDEGSVEQEGSQEQADEPKGDESAEQTAEESAEQTAEESAEQTAEASVEQKEESGEEKAESGEQKEESEEQKDESVEQTEESGEHKEESAEQTAESVEQAAESAEQTAESVEQDAASVEQATESAEQDAESEEPTAEAESVEQVAESAEQSEQNDESGEQKEDSTEQKAESEEEKEESAEQKEESAEKVEGEASQEQDGSAEQEGASVEKEASAEATEEKESAEKQESDEQTAEETESKEKGESAEKAESDEEKVTDEAEKESAEQEETAEVASEEEATESEPTPEEDLTWEIEIPTDLRPRDHVNEILHLNEETIETDSLLLKTADNTLKELKRIYENAINPLETLYKYRDLSNRHFGDPEIFSKPLVLFMGPWSGGKSSIINYLLDNEYTQNSLRTGAEPSPAYFNLLMWGEEPEVLDGTQLAADWTFSGLQKFGQGLEERLRGLKLPNKLLEKINIAEIPGILEVRKQVSRVFPFNDACQWFIDRADIIFLVYDPSKLDVGPETEAILDQLKGREYQTRIILNKADQVKPEELMRVQGALIWNISPLMSSAQPPVMYSTSLWSKPYEIGAPIRLLHAQERAFLRDLKTAIDKRIENKIASARRFAVRVRNHAKMVDCYLTTYYNHKSVFGNKKLVADQIIEHPQDYHIYEGLSTLTNISRYDLPDPDVYRDFFRLNPLYDFQQLSATCTYFRGCPINRLDIAIAYDLPELVGKYKKNVETIQTGSNTDSSSTKS